MYLPEYGDSPYSGIFLKINNDIMTLYSKWFDTHSEYEAYKNGQNYILPNVSICYNNLDVHYDPYKDPRIIATFNITDVSSPSIIAGKRPWQQTPWFTDVEIDGEIIPYENFTIEGGGAFIMYQFSSIGRHIVKYSFDSQQMTAIDGFTFNGTDYEMESLIIPFGITSIDGINNCYNLTSITIPNSVTSITGIAHCKFTSLTIPNSVVSIGSYTFNACERLTKITIPSSVTSIGDHAFYDCTNLTAITILCETPPNIDASAFGGTTSNCPIYVPANSVDLYKSTLPDFANRIQAIPNA